MKHLAVLFFASCFVFALAWTSQSASAAAKGQALGGSIVSQNDAQTFGSNHKHGNVKPPKDKPKKSKKDPRDCDDDDNGAPGGGDHGNGHGGGNGHDHHDGKDHGKGHDRDRDRR